MTSKPESAMIENRTYDEIQVGDTASISRCLTMNDINLFAVVSGDVNPAHLDHEFAKSNIFQGIIGHGMWGGSLISTVLGTLLPGPGTIYLGQTLRFKRPVKIGDVVTVTLTATEKRPEKHIIVFKCECTNQNGEVVISGDADVIAPTEKVRRERSELPDVRMRDRRAQMGRILDMAEAPAPIPTAVVHPVSEYALKGAVDAYERNLIVPILIGPSHRIHQVAEEENIDISRFELVNTEHSHAAAEMGAFMARQGKVKAIMKGALHTDELLTALFDKEFGVRTDRRMSHVFFMDVPTYDKPLLISDAAINVAPNLDVKKDIVQNAIDLAHALGNKQPKVAILAATESVNPLMQTTLDAAALCKMADRGQITGAILDGPLAFDNAISFEAAKTKGIESPVAGQADILIVPSIEAGNMMAKQLAYLGDALSAGIVMGARVPVILTSRADDELARIASCALALIVAEYMS